MKSTQSQNIICKKLNNAVVRYLVGHTNVVYYNCETNMWNTNKYNGYTINGQDVDTDHVKRFKFTMEKKLGFGNRYEFAASITMTIDSVSFPGWSNKISNPKYNQKGKAVVGNIIVKNKTTGKYELYCKSWIGVLDFFNMDSAAAYGADMFARSGAFYPYFRNKMLLAAHFR